MKRLKVAAHFPPYISIAPGEWMDLIGSGKFDVLIKFSHFHSAAGCLSDATFDCATGELKEKLFSFFQSEGIWGHPTDDPYLMGTNIVKNNPILAGWFRKGFSLGFADPDKILELLAKFAVQNELELSLEKFTKNNPR